jgi:DNA-binding transcriptional regulator YiaG
VLASDELRAFLARMLGWSNERAVELAQRSLALALEHRAALVLSSDSDLVPIAWALHRRTLGADRPFIVCDPRRGTMAGSVRSPANRASGVAAFEAAIGGSLCVRARRLPSDFPALVARLRDADDVLCAICTAELADPRPPLVLPAPLVLPPLARRPAELDRIIAEYAGDAIAELAAPASSFTAGDHAWVRDHAAASLADIEKATLRLVAIRTSRNLSGAAARLGMSVVSLSRWLGRRKLPAMMLSEHGSHR